MNKQFDKSLVTNFPIPRQNFTIFNFEIKIQKVLQEFWGLHHRLFFYRRGIYELIELIIKRHLRIGHEYRPATYYEYDDIRMQVSMEIDLYSDRYPKHAEQFNEVYIENILMMVCLLDDMVQSEIEQLLPSIQCTVTNLHWSREKLLCTLTLEK